MALEFITDRTEEDLLLGNAKGLYQAADLNRVEQDVKELVEMLPTLGTQLALTTKTDWAEPNAFSASEWPSASQMQRYLENVRALAAKLGVAESLPASMDGLTYTGANQIEQTLQAVYTVITATIQIYQFSGEFYAGEETGI